MSKYHALAGLMETGIPGPEGSVSKLHWSEQHQRLTKLAMEILDGEDDGYWGHQQLRSRGNTIEAGTSEILRNIIAERVLGLPTSRSATRRRVSSSAGRSASTRPCRTSWPTRTSKLSWLAHSPTGPLGPSRSATSRRRSRSRRGRRTSATRRGPAA